MNRTTPQPARAQAPRQGRRRTARATRASGARAGLAATETRQHVVHPISTRVPIHAACPLARRPLDKHGLAKGSLRACNDCSRSGNADAGHYLDSSRSRLDFRETGPAVRSIATTLRLLTQDAHALAPTSTVSDVSISSSTFHRRAASLFDHWEVRPDATLQKSLLDTELILGTERSRRPRARMSRR